ncbi:MAG: S8 family serine peptidase [Chitinophagales bacterium]
MKRSLLALLLPVSVYAQNSTINTRLLDSLHAANIKYVQEQLAVNAYLQEGGLPLQFATIHGGTVQAHVLRNGMPMFYTTDNLNSAKTDGAYNVWPGGTAGLSLTGSGIQIREWDAGKLRTDHQELTGRASMGSGQTTSYSSHSTHVAGTMIASGIDPDAKGHAYQATVKGFDWDNDIDEMTTEASAGMLMSNHSYSYIAGWYYNGFSHQWEWYGDGDISLVEDYIFGNYLDESRDADLVCNAAPFYLPVIAAANNRGEDVPTGESYKLIYDGSTHFANGSEPQADGPYDCIPGGLGTAKNVLTIGAVDDIPGGYTGPGDVSVASFSGFGPCDDGRIKPDVVANGISLKSCTSSSTSSYDYYSGTSMATPSTTGSIALLQQHFHNLFGNYMLSATVKALVINTADRAQTAYFGPSYATGWGLLNTDGAALLLSDVVDHPIRLQENTLNNGASYTCETHSDGTTPIRVTIAWNDPAASVPAAALDPTTKMLVNDLDLRLVRLSDNTTFYPFRLDAANPGNAPTIGDNITDNVEYVYLAVPAAGDYRIVINHKGTLSGGHQDYALVLTGLSCRDYAITVNATIDAPATYTLPDGSVVSTSGTYITALPAAFGCDSTITTNLTVNTTGCEVPTGIFSNHIGVTSAQVHWTAVADALKYQVYYRFSGAASWQKKNTTSTGIKLKALTPDADYEYKVRAVCPSGNSDFSAIYTFTTLPPKEGDPIVEDVIIYPNPNNGTFHVTLPVSGDEQVRCVLYDVTGKVCSTHLVQAADGICEIQTDHVPAGLYVLQIYTNSMQYSGTISIVK